ncbi:LLM class flavin-dependent oxidoreductase [Pseudoclavibacter chungangensis]|uniref:LLM class flavin-dependent oxidoreductase n=1 Tax=Pseudoclavibacter chungangensis TaxID=587635 RepID=A0A7J5BSP6_9MICO|nr:LLM class flavin-dependent oxidoreductase [Pseudoclavibacter chungangensis]KAB1657335.1 LLM class flavin-dependent oxidoreductase [Pseudoclavibacter chungangensis]NYJ66209.1 alkanesulfonate monooxygenase SsuD/methylene tetrahydromethanopterin reductase-like flavin-dependent oxidoreductase (luciferase family) [Pseudoclavibacter chungangensis]
MTKPDEADGRDRPPILAVALDGAGWHPAAWRADGAEPRELTSIRYWRSLVADAERAGADLVTFEDSFGAPHRDDAETQRHVTARLDALLVASAVAPSTSRIGLVPTVTVTHTEPFHVATALQTLDFASLGRAGWQVRVSPSASERSLTGRRDVAIPLPYEADDPETARRVTALFDEAGDVVEVSRRLWDSWEDDAIIRDAPTGRFLDRDRIHNANFEGDTFAVEGASIVPRSPQAQPLVAALAHASVPFAFTAEHADLVYTTPHDEADAIGILAELGELAERADRPARGLAPLRRLADLVVLLDERPGRAAAELARLDELDGTPLASDALVFAGTPDELVDLVRSWTALGFDGVRFRPARLPGDLAAIAETVGPALVGDRSDERPGTLRDRLGLERPANRYATNRVSA